jgi:tRNA dimethylallyltransferase
MGPTAAGKTDLAIHLAQHYPFEIISVDSALVYRGMDIGTAKPEPDILKAYPHHLVDILDPTESYSVGDFQRDASQLMANISQRGKIPLLVGGTMLYFRALQQGLAKLPEANHEIRQRLDQEIAEHGLLHLHQRLQKIDPVAAQRIHPNDPQRLQRALEVYEITGKSMTDLITETESTLPYRVVKLILSPFERAVLHKRIADRYHLMLDKGFIAEVERFYSRPDCHAALPSIRCVGYRQVWRYLEGDYDQQTSIEKAIVATRQMAKRQLTWLRSNQDGTWFDTEESLPLAQITQFLSDNFTFSS